VSADKEEKYRQFHKVLLAAYRAFLDHESRVGEHPNAAVRAAQFNEFILTHYQVLKKDITPDICEEYMKRYHYLGAPLDSPPEDDVTPAQRSAQAKLAYGEFRREVAFTGTKEAEVIAFHDYVKTKYPHTLDSFTENEAEEAMANWKSSRHGSYLKYALATVCTLALAALIPATPRLNDPAIGKPKAPTPTLRNNHDAPPLWRQPAIGPLNDPWMPPPQGQFIGQDPRFLPPAEPMDTKAIEEWDKSWQERLKKLHEEQRRKDGQDQERQR
jgi:hypothetical protein